MAKLGVIINNCARGLAAKGRSDEVEGWSMLAVNYRSAGYRLDSTGLPLDGHPVVLW